MTAKLNEMNAALLACFLQGGSDYLARYKDEVNALNVFPVPDGDTGINMYLTISSAVKNIAGKNYGSVGELGADFAMGALMGARGNSGVILSQIFRGLSQSIMGKKNLDAVELAQALQKGVDLSYKSVMKPVEGTILTVFRYFALAAAKAAQPGGNIIAMLQTALEAGQKSLENTPELLPVLKEAGVVDAGGKGLLIIMEGGLRALRGEDILEMPLVSMPKQTSGPAPKSQPAKKAPPPTKESAAVHAHSKIEFVFDIQMLIKGENIPLDEIRERLSHNPPGDCLLVVGTPEVVKIHFHSNLPWQVLEYAAGFGTLHDIVIENMADQSEHMHQHAHDYESMEMEDTAAPITVAAPPEPCATAVIAVCAGEGLANIFTSMGATVIAGGQTMNPSAEDLLTAIENSHGKEVILLPNNSNIILTAAQAQKMAQKMSGKTVHVVPSKFVTQGLTALLSYDKNQPGSANAGSMNEAITQGVPCEITYAVRESKYNGFNIQPGDILALCEGEIAITGKELEPVLLELLEQVIADDEDFSLISFFYGEEVTAEQADALAETLRERWPDFDVEYHSGGQPLYYLLLSVE